MLTNSTPYTFVRGGYFYYSRRVPSDLTDHYSYPRIVKALPSVQTTENGPETYLQVATLQNRARAEEVVAKLITAGLQAEIRERQTDTKILYRIIVGPAFSAEALEVMLSFVKELGFKDAIVLG